MKKLLALILALSLALFAASALADNATIAVHGRDGFNDYISSMFIVDGKLLLGGYSNMYTWTEDEGLVMLEGYSELSKALEPQEDGDRVIFFGEDEFELEEDESAAFHTALYTAEDKLYRIALVTGDEGAVCVLLVELDIDEDGKFVLTRAVDLGTSLIDDYGGGMFSLVAPDQAVYVGGVLYGLGYSLSGHVMVAIDVEDESADMFALDTDADVNGIAAFNDESLLLIGSEFVGATERTALLLYDVNDDEVTELGLLPASRDGVANAPCYDAERGMLYYVQGGSVWRVAVTESGIGTPEAFGDMPLELYSGTTAMYGDMYVISSFDGVLGRDVTVEKMPAQRLVIRDATEVAQPVRNAYFDFTAQHPEFAVSILSGGSDKDTLLQSMMSRSSDVDIYVMYAYDDAFSPLLSRGYMAELGGSQKLNDFMSKVYPFLRDASSKNGEIYAVPIDILADVPTLNMTALSKFGYTQEDLPTTWPELFDLFSELSERMEEFPELYLFGPDDTLQGAKMKLFGDMMSCYLLWLEEDDAHLARGNEMLLSLIDAFAKIDWDGFDLPDEPQTLNGLFFYEPKNNIYVKQSASPMMCTMGSLGDYESATLSLALAEGEEPLTPAEVQMMFVNPFSKHREEAIEYIEDVTAQLSKDVIMSLMPDVNEPIPSSSYEETKKMYDKMLADEQAALERAERNEDDELIATHTMNIESLQDTMAWFERSGRWDVSEEGIAAYREIIAHAVPSRSSLWSSGSLYNQTTQYLAGAITARQYVSELEKTLQMQRLEDM